jgi:hypothetical protein
MEQLPLSKRVDVHFSVVGVVEPGKFTPVVDSESSDKVKVPSLVSLLEHDYPGQDLSLFRGEDAQRGKLRVEYDEPSLVRSEYADPLVRVLVDLGV